MLSPRRSMVSTKLRSSIDVGRGGRSKPSSSRRWNGWTGSTTGGSWSPSATYRRPKLRSATTPCCNIQPWQPDSNQPASRKRGAVQSAVSALQKGLKTFDAPNTPTDPGAIDGNFSQRTESAVRAYQARQSISVDGVVGDQTWWAPAGAAGATLAKLAGLVTA